jgi:AcrR family transcriptional regulator
VTSAEPGAESRNEARRPGRPRDVRHDEAILEAARDILREHGYAGLTIDGVAARAGVGRPTIYRRWSSKPALVVAALIHSNQLAIPVIDTGSLRHDLITIQQHQIELMNRPNNRRVTAGLVADLTADPQLAESYVNEYLAPRRATVWQVLERAVDRGELHAGADFAFIYDLLVGPLFMRSVVWGEQLSADAAEQTADVIVAAFGPRA